MHSTLITGSKLEFKQSSFRPDINGLRALAIAGVIAFHFKVGPLRAGGFAGVDVFFVISGFLMTQIIATRLSASRFSLMHFYEARIRRIVPAFAVLILAVLIASFVLLNPIQLYASAWRTAAAAVFLSNVAFAREGTYFNPPENNWLLHTWTLSVEGQFYALFPVLLMLTHALHHRRWIAPTVLVCFATASFCVMLLSSHADGVSKAWTFYMLWPRAWEFLVGGVSAYLLEAIRLRLRIQRVLHYLGLICIFVTMTTVHVPAPWPSAMTLLPTFGTALVLVAQHKAARWAQMKPVAFLGTRSYSVYLWHWPVAAILVSDNLHGMPWRLGGVLISLALGAASFFIVERKLTDFLWSCGRQRWIGVAVAYVMVGALIYSMSLTTQLEALKYGRDPALLARLRSYRLAKADFLAKDYCRAVSHPAPLLDECRLGNQNRDDVLLVGDSFAGEIEPRYGELSASGPFGLAVVWHPGCLPAPGTAVEECDGQYVNELTGYIRNSKFRRVVFVYYWPMYQQGIICLTSEPDCGNDLSPRDFDLALEEAYRRMARIWQQLKKDGKEVVVFGLVPFPGDNLDAIHLYNRISSGSLPSRLNLARSKFREDNAATLRLLTDATSAAGVILVDPTLSLCPENECPIVRNGLPLYADSAHFRASLMQDERFSIYDKWLLPPTNKGAAPKIWQPPELPSAPKAGFN